MLEQETRLAGVLKPHILVVDDDAAMRELLTIYLSENDMRVSAAASGSEMRAALQGAVIDLVVIDLRLNGEDGMQLARKLREQSAIPVVIITGKQEEADRIMGLEMAADDYLTKPFSNRELLARIRAVLRRYQSNPTELSHASGETKRRAYRFSGWELNVLLRRLTAPNGERVELSNGELNLLMAFCESPRRVLSRDQLLESSRLHGAEVYDRSIDVSILRLRRKIEVNAAAPRYIKTERGAGYIFDSEVEVLS